ncbi:MAG: FG-GAP-like repeat-containing protein [Flavobacteriales bacterium]
MSTFTRRGAWIFALAMTASVAQAQTFTNSSNLLPDTYNSGGCVGFADMDGDGYDDLIVLDQSNTLHTLYQTPEGGFVDYNLGQVSNNSQWGMCVADFDNDGHKDVFSGGSYDGVHVQHITAPGVSNTLELADGSMFMQACNWVDIDNDGVLDVFGCHDDALSRMWQGNEDGTLSPAPQFIDLTDYDLQNYPGNDHSGNYGTVWTDFDSDGDIDLFIAKCRQFVNDPQDPRRINQLWVNDGNGGWTEEALERGLVLYEQSWTTDFADIDNDGDFDCLATNHSSTIQLLENDGTGHFTNITAGSGLEVTGFFLQAKMDDFDNDGFVDLIYTGGADGFFRNNGDMTFTEVPNLFPWNDTMHSFASGDVNRDGQLDVYASYGNSYVSPDNGNPDILWVNDGNDNHWIAFDLEGFESNIDAVGAKVELTGDFGTMVREVRGGESYGITCTFACRFGLGQHETVTQATVKWPSGLETVIDNPAIDQYHNVLEVPCTVDVTATASAEGFCPGESVTLTAPEGFASYEWSNGAETPTTEVSAGGAYSVLVYDDAGCAGFSNLLTVTEIVGNVPTIAVDGDVNLCDGGMLTLTASNADNFIWSTGDESQSIEVTTSGAYAVYSVDICGNDGVSDTLFVEVYDAPLENPTVTPDQTIPAPASVDLNATGENITWYDAAMGGNAVATGNDFSSMVDATVTYWAEDVRVNAGETQIGGELQNQPGGAYHTNSQRWLEFDVHADIRLNSVTLYANGTFERSFELINEFGMVLESTTQNVTDGTFVLELGWDIEPGANYGLRCTTNDPQLWREGTDSDLNYPYEMGDLLTVTNSTAGPSLQYYYFFYAWQAEPLPVECASDRVPTTITVEGTSSLAEQENGAWTVGPNPVNRGDVLALRGLAGGTPMTVVDVQGRVVFEGAWTGHLQVNWPAGWYTLRVVREGQAQHQTLVVK